MVSVRNFVHLFSFALVLFACNREKPHAAEEHEGKPSAAPHASGEHEHEELARRVSVKKEVVESAGIKTVPVARAVLAQTLSLPGEIAADPDRLARISTPTAGRIEEVRFREGEPVKKGAALVVVRVPEIAKVRASLKSARAKAQAARANADRLKLLVEQQLAAAQESLNADAEAQALELEASALAEELGALGAGSSGAISVTIRSPIDGIAVARDAVVGQPASVDRTLGTIADLSEVWFLARVFEKDLGQLKLGSPAEVHLNAYADQHFQGKVEYVGQQIDSVARTVNARVRLVNRDSLLRLGLFGTCQIANLTGEKAEPKLVVSQSSVTEVGGRPVVFVRESETDFELHEVTLGRESLGRVEILAGLREGEKVVSDGVFTLKSLVLKGSFAEDEH